MKKLLCRGLSLLLAALLLPLPYTALFSAAVTAGDVDQDGKVTASDARLALRAAVGLEILADDPLRAADADRDNKITAADARLILRAAVGLETLLPMPEYVQTVVYQAKGFPATALSFPGGKAETLGTPEKSGMTMTVTPGSLTAGAVVSATPLTKAEFDRVPDNGMFERVLFPMKLACEGYDGGFFDDGVRVTVPLLEGTYDDDTPYDRFVFCYYDEAAGEIRILYPDEIDTEAHTMTVSLPHFSWWFGAKLTTQEQIERFLDSYCTELAVLESERKTAASELEPYLKAKADALGLTANAAADLVQCAVNYLGGSFVVDQPGSEQVGSLVSIGTNYTTTMLRAYYDGNTEGAKEALSGAADAALQQSWQELKFSERAGEVFKKEYVKEFVPGAIDTLISNFGSLGTIFGCLCADDPEGALQAVGDVLQGVHPGVALATKAIAFAGTALHTSFTFWKADQIESLYQTYKNGGRFLFCNEVFPRDRQSFLMFLNASSGFTLAKGVNRFYKLDKIGEICEKYGWSFRDYKSMPQKYRDIFEKRAEDGLMTYFETRAAQEDAAEKLKEAERACIRTMLYETMGALKRTNFRWFFRDDTATYDVGNRLERLTRVKAFIRPYVDETKLNADKYTNWGHLLNWWISYASQYRGDKTRALGCFIGELKQMKLLRAGMENEYKKSAAKQFFGTWVGYYTWYEFREWVQKEGTKWTFEPVYDTVVTKYTYTIGLDLQGRLTIRRREEKVEKNGEPYANPPKPLDATSHLTEKDYRISDGTLIVPSKDNIGGYSMKFKGSLNSYQTHTQWDYEKEDFVDYEICIECKKEADIGKAR